VEIESKPELQCEMELVQAVIIAHHSIKHTLGYIAYFDSEATPSRTRMLLSNTSSLNSPSCDLSSVQTNERWCGSIFVFASLHFYVGCGEDDLNVARVTLVGVDTTVGTICAAAGFL